MSNESTRVFNAITAACKDGLEHNLLITDQVYDVSRNATRGRVGFSEEATQILYKNSKAISVHCHYETGFIIDEPLFLQVRMGINRLFRPVERSVMTDAPSLHDVRAMISLTASHAFTHDDSDLLFAVVQDDVLLWYGINAEQQVHLRKLARDARAEGFSGMIAQESLREYMSSLFSEYKAAYKQYHKTHCTPWVHAPCIVGSGAEFSQGLTSFFIKMEKGQGNPLK